MMRSVDPRELNTMIVYLEIGGDKIDDDAHALFEKALIDAHRNPYRTASTVAQN